MKIELIPVMVEVDNSEDLKISKFSNLFSKKSSNVKGI